jgi:hypothetical protein
MSSISRIAPGLKMPAKVFKLANGGETCIASIKPGKRGRRVGCCSAFRTWLRRRRAQRSQRFDQLTKRRPTSTAFASA